MYFKYIIYGSTFHTLSIGSVDSELVTVRAMSPLTAGLSVTLPCLAS